MKILILTCQSPRHVPKALRKLLHNLELLYTWGYEPIVLVTGKSEPPNEAEEPDTDVPKKPTLYYLKQTSAEPPVHNDNFGPAYFQWINDLVTALNPAKVNGWQHHQVNSADEAFRMYNPAMIITSGPLYSTHTTGLALKKQNGVKWLADLRPYSKKTRQYEPMQGSGDSLRQKEMVIASILKEADIVTVSAKDEKTAINKDNEQIHILPDTKNGYTPDVEELCKILNRLTAG